MLQDCSLLIVEITVLTYSGTTSVIPWLRQFHPIVVILELVILMTGGTKHSHVRTATDF